METYTPVSIRRACARFRWNIEGRLLFKEKDALIICRDVSGRGLGLASNKALDINSIIYMKIYIPWLSRWQHEKGRVVWCKQLEKSYYHCGVDFLLGYNLPINS